MHISLNVILLAFVTQHMFAHIVCMLVTLCCVLNQLMECNICECRYSVIIVIVNCSLSSLCRWSAFPLKLQSYRISYKFLQSTRTIWYVVGYDYHYHTCALLVCHV